MSDELPAGPTRRQVLGGAAAGAGIAAVAWATPSILSVDAAAAATAPPLFIPLFLAGSGDAFIAAGDNGTGGTSVRHSTDGGFNWSSATDQLIGVPTYLSGGAVALLGGPLGFATTSDGGMTWGSVADPPSVTPIDKVAQDWGVVGSGDTYEWAAGTPDGYASTTSPLGVFDPGSTILSGGNGIYLIAGTQLGNLSFSRSSDGGNNWQFPGVPPMIEAAPTVFASDASSAVVYVGTDWLYTSNSGGSWATPAVAPTSFTPAFLVGGPAKFLAVDAAGATWYSINGGANWVAGQPLGITPSLVAGYGINTSFVVASASGELRFTIDPTVSWMTPTTPPLP